MQSMPTIFQAELFGNSLVSYLIALGTFIAGTIAIQVLKCSALTHIKQWTRRTATTVDDHLVDLFERHLFPLLYVGVFYVSIRDLQLLGVISRVIDAVSLALLTFFTVQFLGSLAEYGVRLYCFSNRNRNANLEQSTRAIVPAIRVVCWTLGIIFLLDNLGFNISAIVAALGVGGVAVALASQGILQDLFSYFAILFDRPFEIGDFIIVDDFIGTVEYIGIKTTRINSLSGEGLVISNTDLTAARIRNFNRMKRRRVVFSVRVTYATGLSKLQQIPELIRSTIVSMDGTEFDRAHFFAFGDFSLDFEVVYYVLGKDYNTYMDVQQAINLKIKQQFEQQQIEFAYPTQVTYFNLDGDQEVPVHLTDGKVANGNGVEKSLVL